MFFFELTVTIMLNMSHSLLVAWSDIPTLGSISLLWHKGLTENNAAMLSSLTVSNLVSLISVLLFTVHTPRAVSELDDQRWVSKQDSCFVHFDIIK